MAVKASPTVEDYLHVIYQMSREGKPVIGTHLAEKMSVAVATTFATVQRMQKAGLVHMNEHKEILLTDDGKEAAEGVVRRHALAERLLVDVLRLPWHEAHEEAHQFEHVISPRVGESSPATSESNGSDAVRLSSVPQGESVSIVRISEEAEESRSCSSTFSGTASYPAAAST